MKFGRDERVTFSCPIVRVESTVREVMLCVSTLRFCIFNSSRKMTFAACNECNMTTEAQAAEA